MSHMASPPDDPDLASDPLAGLYRPQSPSEGDNGHAKHASESAPSRIPHGIRAWHMVIVIATVALLGWGTFAYWQNQQAKSALEIGNCITLEGSAENVTPALVDCDEAPEPVQPFLVAEVTKDNGTCTNDLYVNIALLRGSIFGDEDSETLACLVPQFSADQCYYRADGMNYEAVDCDAGSADFRVTKVITEADGDCGEAQAISYPEPGITYCLEPAG